jgi:coproporphyrinogen III oxidase
MITSDFRKEMADSWFSYLQSQICKEFEFLENNKIKFSRRDWKKKNERRWRNIISFIWRENI